LATVAIFSFLWSYNDLFVQKIMMRDPTRYPISTLLEQISSQYGTDFGLMAASVTIIVIPVMIVYVLLQKNIIKGLTAGAVKG
ncbi:MAG: carbohydrate ABC transporter permease, partial [Roseburia hominis]